MNTIRQLQQKPENKLPAGELEIFLAAVLKKSKEWVIAHPEKLLSPAQAGKFRRLAGLRKRGYSVAALCGHKEFYGLDFLVGRNALIPRPETELMVEEALKALSQNTGTAAFLLDIGTGTGCIPIAVLKNTDKKIYALAADGSAPALRLAKKNAKKHGVNIKFFRGNLLAPIVNFLSGKRLGRSILIITANLPYLTEKQFYAEPSIRKEPKRALVADNKGGLSLYEKLFGQIKKFLPDKNILLFIEIDPRQSKKASFLVKKYFPSAKLEIKKDLSGRDRVLKINF